MLSTKDAGSSTQASEVTELREYYTRSFAILHEALTSPPSNFPWVEVLDTIKPALKEGMKCFENREPKEDVKLYAKQKDLVNELSKRTNLNQKSCYRILEDFLLCEAHDNLVLDARDPFVVDKITNFYYSERLLLLECISTIFRIDSNYDEEEDADDIGRKACHDVVTWLLSQDIEGAAQEWIKDASNIEQHLKNLKLQSLSEIEITKRRIELIEQKLNEQAAALNVLFMIYYEYRYMCDTKRFPKFFNEHYIGRDFGNSHRNLENISTKGFQIIRRIVCLSFLVIVEILDTGNIVECINKQKSYQNRLPENIISKLTDEIRQEIGNDPHCAALRLLWASYLQLTTNNVPLNHIYNLIQQGIKFEGLEFIRRMFDKDDYAFHGHDANYEGYRSVIKTGIESVYFLFQFHKVPFSLIEQIFSVTEAAIQTKSGMLRENPLAQDLSDYGIEQQPYKDLLNYFKLVFPAKKEILRLFTLICNDHSSTLKVLNIMESQETYCVELTHSELKTLCGIDPLNPNDWDAKETPLQTIMTYKDETTNVIIPSGIPCLVVNQTAEKCLVTFQFSSYIWKVLLCQIIEVLQNSISIQTKDVRSMIHHFLNLLHKLIYYRGVSVEKLDKYIIELLISKQMYSHRSEKKGIIQLLSRIIKYFSNFPIGSIPMEILISCCNCLNAIATVAPVETASQVCYLIQKYHFSNILREECMNGRYGATLSLLDTILELAKNHPGPMTTVMDILPFICSSIFSLHDSWRYQKLEERWLIALKCIQIFNQVATDSIWIEHKTEDSKVSTGGRQLLTAFLRDSSLYQVLFLLVGLGGAFLETVTRHEKTEEAVTVQSLIKESLTLLDSLLRFRQITKTSNSISGFEDVLFSKLLGKQQIPLITSIFEFTDPRHYTSEVRVLACKVITLIAQLTEDYNSRPPSLVGYLGSHSTSLVGRCLDTLQSRSEPDELKIAIFDLISVTVEIQRGLGELFVNSSPPHIKKKVEEDDELTLPPGGCIETIMNIVRDIELKKSKPAVVRSAIGVIQSIFQSGESRSRITKILRNQVNFWKDMVKVLSYFTSATSLLDIDVVRSVTSVLSIFAVDMYNMMILKNDEDVAFNQVQSPLFEKDSKIQQILKKSIERVIEFTNQNRRLILNIDEMLKNESKKLGRQIHLSDYIQERNTKIDVLYDTDRLKRWEHDISNELLISLATLNASIAQEEAYISLLRSMNALFSVRFESPLLAKDQPNEDYFQSNIRLLLDGLKVKEKTNPYEVSTSAIHMTSEIHLPLPIILDKLVTTFHTEVASMLETFIHKYIVLFPPSYSIEVKDNHSDDSIKKLTDLLIVQVQRNKLTVSKEILGCLLMYYVDLGSNVGIRNFTSIMPTLFYIVKTFDKYDDCTNLALSILSICVENIFDSEQGNYICRELADCLSNFDGVDEHHSKYTLNILNLLLSLSSTQAGSTLMVANNVIPRLTNCSILSTGSGKYAGQSYYEGERTWWHTAWKYSLKIVTSLLNSFDFANHPQRYVSGSALMFDESSGQAQYFFYQVFDFCNAHRNRLILGLNELWDKRPLTFAIIEEVELISMLVNALARLKLLPQLVYLIDASLVAMLKCIDAVKHFHSVLGKVTPITAHERKLHEADKHYREEYLQGHHSTLKTRNLLRDLHKSYENTYMPNPEESPFISSSVEAIKNLYQGRETLNWNTQIDLIVYGTLQSILASIRCLTVLPKDDGIEMPVDPVYVLSMQSHSPNIRDIFKCIESCVDALEYIPSRKYTDEAKVTALESGAITPTTLSPSYSCTATERVGREQETMLKSRILVSRVVIGTMYEALHVAITHLLIYEFLSEGDPQKQSQVKELKEELNKLFGLYKKLEKPLKSWFFLKYGDQLKELIKFLKELQV
ncbi:hypothetical protein C9374_009747 [Naegleria lovaniensis]|uniref:Uncharacterized protein n=1 Tax=Naegleria lovaniensis TaxID=51637 RepID=A0AA88GY72_NAELO|nr:uncharacterized protein C9374_009747 [Naegleria lovaniensis]KAG2393170.1 hypothetical protein C9374_009747 [Naegleria lovaniensis]